jgi:hypothetical protein
MDIVKFKITSKTIKIELRNSENYYFDFNNVAEVSKEDKAVLLKLHHALGVFFRKETIPEDKNNIPPNQTNIIDQIQEVTDSK